MSLSRRDFLGLVGGVVGAPALVGLARKGGRPIAGGFVDDGGASGHRLRDRRVVPRPSRPPVRVPIVIVGGGIAGLSAAWELERRGMRDFVLLELAREAGGNARSGANDVSAYPWAAHYVPVPPRSATLVRELFRELGVLRDDDTWEERHLCFSPQERLFRYGEWHAGLEPEFALGAEGRAQFARFDALVAEQRASGRFTIPSVRAPRLRSGLDRLTMAAWMREHGLTAPELRWYVDYACRDDYGALAADTSAWAGIHYFASRAHDEQGPLTWPEGNGWIAKRLLAKLARWVRTDAPVSRIARAGTGWRVTTPGAAYDADVVVWAAPTFVAPYVVEGMETRQARSFVYSPWVTANLTLDRWPAERARGAEPAWDNVIYDSPGLGYVVATHQSLRSRPAREEPTVWTYYWSLAELPPAEGRRLLLARDWRWFRDRILADLARAHPDIRDCVRRVDVMRHGHAMIRPTVGFLGAPERAPDWAPPRLLLAHSDQSGLSLFEEAQERGVAAARRAMVVVGG